MMGMRAFSARVVVAVLAASSFLLSLGCAHAPSIPPVRAEAPFAPAPGLERLLAAARADERAFDRLAELCDTIGPRLAGSAALDRAIDWGERTLRDDGLANVHREKAMVPAWVRGRERLQMTAPMQRELLMAGLGNSVGTPGIEAPVVVVHSFEELSPAVGGKIVLYNVPMGAAPPAIARYGEAVQYRGQGASRAAAFGAVAILLRSVTAHSLSTPHTGALHYDEKTPKIPSAAVTVEDAEWIDRLAKRGVQVRVRLEMDAKTLPDAESHNVIGEIVGSDRPEEVVLIGGHLDSWDIAPGAHDDGAGVVHVIEAMRLIKSIGLAPKRTIRAVLFTNEENGLRGGRAYAAAHGTEPHLAAIETDLGAGRPIGWGASGSAVDLAWLRRALAPLGLPVNEGGGGADISPLKGKARLMIGLQPDDAHYFDVHHTTADTLDKVDPVLLREGVAAVAGIAWQLANAEGPSATSK